MTARPRPAQSEARPETVFSLLPESTDGEALVTVDRAVLDHGNLRRHVERLSAKLAAFGIRPGDRVAIVLPNGPEMTLALLAVMSVGCAAPLNPRYRQEEFRFYLEDLRPAALLTFDGESPVDPGVVPDGVLHIGVHGRGFSIEFGEGDDKLFPQRQEARSAPDDPALVLHTSGTTSRPKIVPLRQRHLARSARNIAASLQLTADDRSLNVMPLFHIHGIMAGMLAPLSAGGAVICSPGFDAFKFGRWLDELRPTFYSAVPTMHWLVLARGGKPRPTTLRFVRSSSAALPRSLLDGLRDFFEVPVLEAYGMTEATHQMTCNPLPPAEAKPGSVGLPAGIEVAILGGDGQLLPAPGRGEVVIKGATVLDGYEGNPEANAAAFVSGWFRSGDEGFLDQDGYLFLTGRLKEQINRGGEKISPLEIEEVLLGHPAVAEAVAFAVPDDKLGEEVGAAVVLAEGEQTAEQELRSYVAGWLAAFKVPQSISFMTEIPKGPTGKVQRVGMAERLGIRRDADPTIS